jgi:predicted nucleic acid-binding protein
MLFETGRQLYAGRLDKEWSLTDCTSFVVMREYAASDALTTDHHFEQAGFNVLLK